MELDIANPYIVKCVLLGDRAIGKSTMLHMLMNKTWNCDAPMTIGVDFSSKNIFLMKYDQEIKMRIWDTAGQEKYRSMILSYIRGTHIALLMFDLSDRSSWNSLGYWKNKLEENCRYESIPMIVLIGTKSDLKSDIINYEISDEEISERANEWNCKSYIISSKNPNAYTNIYRMFIEIAEGFHEIILHNHEQKIELPNIIYREEISYSEPMNQSVNCCKLL